MRLPRNGRLASAGHVPLSRTYRWERRWLCAVPSRPRSAGDAVFGSDHRSRAV